MKKIFGSVACSRIFVGSLVSVVFFSTMNSEASQWSSPSTIDNNANAYDIAFTCFINSTNQIVSSWANYNSHSYLPQYSIASFSNGSWSWSPQQSISTDSSQAVLDNVFTSYVNLTNQIFAVWSAQNVEIGGISTYYPTYSIASYIEGVWNWSSLENITTSSKVYENVALVFASATNQMVAVWNDGSNYQYPTYSIASYIEGAWNWTPASVFDEGSTVGVYWDVSICYASETNQIVAVWSDSTDYNPYYSIANYVGEEWTWSTPVILNNLSTSGVEENVYVSYLSATNQMVAIWSDYTNNYYPTYSIASYVDGMWSWSLPAVLNQNSTSEVDYNVIVSYAASTNQIFATWNDFNNNNYPTYSIASFVNGSWSWSLPAVISSAVPVYHFTEYGPNVFPCYVPFTSQIFTTWLPVESPWPPYYSIYFLGKNRGNGVSINGSSGTGVSMEGGGGNGK